MNAFQVTENYAVSPQIEAEDVKKIAAAGYKAVICNRPDGEEPDQPTAAEIAAACEQAGLAFFHIPVAGAPIAPDAIGQHRDAVTATEGPVFAYCKSGQRSAVIYESGIS